MTRAQTAIEKDWSELKKVRNDFVSVARMDLNSTALENKNMIDERDYQHNLALCYACADGNYEAVKSALINRQILAIDDSSDNGYILLDDKNGIVENTVDYVIDWQDKNSDGDTAAHMAAYSGSKKIVQLLFSKGWTPTLKNYSNITIHQTAKDYGYHESLANWIKSYVVKHSSAFNYEFGNNDNDVELDDSNRSNTTINNHTSNNFDQNDNGGGNLSSSNNNNNRKNDNVRNKIKKDNYVVNLKDFMTNQECIEIEKRWLNERTVTFKLPFANKKVETIVVKNSNDRMNNSKDNNQSVYVLKNTISQLTEEKAQLETYITERLGKMQEQYRASIMNMRRQHEMELKALEELDGEWKSMKDSLWKGRKK